MKCKKCEYDLREDWKICPKCSNLIENNNFVGNTENTQENRVINVKRKQETPIDGKYKIYLIIFLVSISCGFLIKQVSGLAFLVALISIVTGYIKYPKSRAIKVLFWLFLAGVAGFILFFVFLIFTCISSYSCPGA